MTALGLQLKGNSSKTEKPHLTKQSQLLDEVESCVIASVIKSPRAQNTCCQDNPGNSNSNAQVSHFKITQGTRNPKLWKS